MYTSGGRVVGRSNRLTPTNRKAFKIYFREILKAFFMSCKLGEWHKKTALPFQLVKQFFVIY